MPKEVEVVEEPFDTEGVRNFINVGDYEAAFEECCKDPGNAPKVFLVWCGNHFMRTRDWEKARTAYDMAGETEMVNMVNQARLFIK